MGMNIYVYLLCSCGQVNSPDVYHGGEEFDGQADQIEHLNKLFPESIGQPNEWIEEHIIYEYSYFIRCEHCKKILLYTHTSI